MNSGIRFSYTSYECGKTNNYFCFLKGVNFFFAKLKILAGARIGSTICRLRTPSQ